MRKTRIAFVLTIVLMLGLVAVLPQASYAQDEQPVGGASTLYLPAVRGGNGMAVQQPEAETKLVVHSVPASEQAATEKFWTRERMMAAKPLDVLHVTAEQAAAAQAATAAEAAAAQATGPRGSAPAGKPDPNAAKLAQQLYAEEWARLAAEDASPVELQSDMQAAGTDQLDTYASAPPFVSYYVNYYGNTWKYFPWITMGRIFFQIPGSSTTYACSAAAAYGRAVWTSGHCVYTPGKGWSLNMYFVPAYRNGAFPYGSFTVFNMTTTNAWFTSGSLSYDLGMVAVNDKSGLKLSQWVGSLGFLYNAPAAQLFHAFAYPGNYSNGMYLVTCVSSLYKRDGTVLPLNPLGIGCDMGAGSSGGPWVVAYAPFRGGATNYINGMISYSYPDRPLEVYGPYFGTVAKQLYDWGTLQ